MSPTVSDVRRALSVIVDPCSVSAGCPLSIDEMGLITGVAVRDGSVSIKLRVTMPGCLYGFMFQREIQERVEVLPGVRQVQVELTDDKTWSEADISEDGRIRLAETRQKRAQLLTIKRRKVEPGSS